MASKKKIAFIVGGLSSGGAERIISNLSNQLINSYNVSIITFKKSEPFYKLHEGIKVIYCLENIDSPTNIFASLKLNFVLIQKTLKILKEEKINLAIGFITSANIITVITSKLASIPSIISERNNPLIAEVPIFWRILRKYVYPRADFVILQTQGIKDYYKNKIAMSKMTILPNPIAKELSDSRDKSIERKNIILSVGRLTEDKCHRILIHAFENLNVENWKTIIVGSGPNKEKLESLIDELNIGHKVKLIEATKDIAKYYNEAKIFVFTSRSEGFPNALLEAMHYGLPCISTDCQFGPSDLIKDGKNGYLIPVNDQKMLNERLLLLMSNEKLRVAIGNEAELSTRLYDSQIVQKKWIEVIERFIKKK